MARAADAPRARSGRAHANCRRDRHDRAERGRCHAGRRDPGLRRRPQLHGLARARARGDPRLHAAAPAADDRAVEPAHRHSARRRAPLPVHAGASSATSARDDGRTYALRPRILALGHAYLSSTPLVNAVQPLLDQITSDLHESCSMAVLEGDEILYIARSSTTTRMMSIDLGIGSRLPAYCTSMGRVLLAGLARRASSRLSRRASSSRRSPAAPCPTPDELKNVLADGAARRLFASSTRSWRSACARSRSR